MCSTNSVQSVWTPPRDRAENFTLDDLHVPTAKDRRKKSACELDWSTGGNEFGDSAIIDGNAERICKPA